MPSAEIFPLIQFGRLEARSKVSILILLAAGALVCTTAYAQEQLVNVADSESAILQEKLSPRKVLTNLPRVRTQDPRVYSITREDIPGLEAAKTPPQPEGADPDSPAIYISGEYIDGQADSTVRVEGRGQVIRDTTVIQGEELTYNRQSEVVTAKDNVRINHEGNLFVGESAELHVPTNQGHFDAATYQIRQTGAHGESNRINFTGKNIFSFEQASYTLCQVQENGQYDWILVADSIELDFDADEGVARNAVLRFMNVPILATPWMSFPLSNKRRSGLLVPYFDISDDNGFTYSQPYYWNIAPNYDATITPFMMTKRGVGFEGEFRYLHPTFNGVFTGLFLPNDKLRRNNNSGQDFALIDPKNLEEDDELYVDRRQASKRWAYTLDHNQLLANNLPVLGQAQLQLDLNRVSDHYYWQDFPRGSGSLMSRLLNNEGTVTTHKNGFSSLVRVQRWQTLQDPDAYIIPPYDRTQLKLNYGRNVNGFNLSVLGDLTDFDSDDETRNSSNATRGVFKFTASYPYRTAGFFFVPKFSLTSRYYNFKDGINYSWTEQEKELFKDFEDRDLPKIWHSLITQPTFSLDAGAIFERKAALFSKDYIQTLEPRVMYTYTPYREQNYLPLYDSSEYDYNLATVYLDNSYSGYDRIADVNMVTVGVGTKWLNPQTGQQALGFNIAQRLRLANQRITINGEPITNRYSDVLLNVSTELIPNWRFDALVQFDTDERRSQRSLIMARWKPAPYRVLNVGYRMQHQSSEQIDVSWQWPLGSPWLGTRLPTPNESGGRWFSVGRVNYSLRDSKLVDGIFGVEYQSCCWIGRVVLEQMSTGRTKANTRLLFQLEFSGLSRVGINPLQRLQDNINHYEVLRNERIVRPNDFYLYE